ncbi:MAG: trimethylamine--corrinoid methyltransferase, partial [Bacteroidetes bacterium]
SQLLVLEQIVVDHEIALMCQRYKDGIDVSDAKDLYGDVKSAQAGGHFLMQPGTLKYCRSNEFFQPGLSDRNTYEHWEDLDKPDLYSNARKKVEEILAGPLKNPLPDEVLGKLTEIQRRADEALKK